MMRVKIWNRFAPSRTAASSSSLGSEMKNCRSKKTPRAPAALGTITAKSVSSQPRVSTTRYRGVIRIIDGMNSVEMMMANIRFLPRKCILARAYAAGAAVTSTSSVWAVAAIRLFTNHRNTGVSEVGLKSSL
jgi:hypothetical protein